MAAPVACQERKKAWSWDGWLGSEVKHFPVAVVVDRAPQLVFVTSLKSPLVQKKHTKTKKGKNNEFGRWYIDVYIDILYFDNV